MPFPPLPTRCPPQVRTYGRKARFVWQLGAKLSVVFVVAIYEDEVKACICHGG